jgi:type IV pilus assembly protein PilN
MRKRVEVIEALTKDQGRPIQLFDAFADMIPRDLWITGLEEKNSMLRVSGSAFTTVAVSDFMANLRASGRFKEVDIVVSRQDHSKAPRLVTFEVTCRFES